jgi:hypothetical protein
MSDKVMRLVRSMVYLALRVQPGRQATPEQISCYINRYAADPGVHVGIVELALRELHKDGRVERAGADWLLSGARA